MRDDAERVEREVAARGVEVARRAGAQHAAATVSRTRGTEVRVRDRVLEHVAESVARTLTIHVYVDGRYGRFDTTDLRDDRIAAFARDAVALTRALERDPHRAPLDPVLHRGAPSLRLADPALVAVDREQRIAWAREMSDQVTGASKVVSSTSQVTGSDAIVALATSTGVSGSYRTAQVDASIGITLDDGARRPEEYAYATVATRAAVPPVTGIADDALARVRARVGAAKGPTRRTAMLVENRVAGALIRRLLRPATAAAVQQGQSLWRGRVGKRVVAPRLTIVDDPTLPGGLASRPFDDEGIASRRRTIIDRGALSSLYVDTCYGAKLGMAPTTGSPSNQIVAPGSSDLPALASAAVDGVLVTSWLGGNMDPTTGAFSYGVSGHLIENGRVGAPIGEMNVSGTIQELFAALVDIGSDTWRYSSERCPSLLFEGVQFAGA